MKCVGATPTGCLIFMGAGNEADNNDICNHERTGRSFGSEVFVGRLETALERPLRMGKPGPKWSGS